MSSIVRKHYYGQCHRITHLPRVVIGTQDSWDRTISVSSRGYKYQFCAWSPCGRFIAAQMESIVEIRNQLTLELATVLKPTGTTHWLTGPLAYSPSGHSLACASNVSTIIWDIQTGGVAKELNFCHNNVSLVWSLDGRMICIISGEKNVFSVQTHNIATGVTLSPGNLQSDDNPFIWAHEKSFQVITIVQINLGGIIEVFNVECTLMKINRICLPWGSPMAHPKITFSSTTCCLSVYADHVLRLFENWSSNCLLQVNGHFFSQFFSSDGSLFGAFEGGYVHVWKGDSGLYLRWKRFSCPDGTNLSGPLFP